MKKLTPLALALLLLSAAAGAAIQGSGAIALNWFAEGACDDALAQNPGELAPCRYDAREDWTGAMCADGVDNDSDEATDCLDSDCPACATACPKTERDADGDCERDEESLFSYYAHACANSADDDGNLATDCADPDCADYPGCRPEICRNGSDDDGDGSVDCSDIDCYSGSECWACVNSPSPENCGPVCPGTEEVCGDGVDQDCDGSDLACQCPWWNPWCVGGGPVCGDGACSPSESCSSCTTDCGTCGGGNPGSCTSSSDCPAGQTCFMTGGVGVCSGCTPGTVWNGSACVPPPEDCGNGIDDNGNGATDCADPICLLDPHCLGEISCNDGADNDFDGATDCGDSECAGNLECLEEADLETQYIWTNDGKENFPCADGIDNDDDGATDCDDRDCDGETTTSGKSVTETDFEAKKCDYPYGAKGKGMRRDESLCSNEDDDDNNGQTDCADNACKALQVCIEAMNCQDGVDNDLDNFVDCFDDDCDSAQYCFAERNCGNGLSDDGDVFIDCEDPDCDGLATPGPNGEFQIWPQENMVQSYSCQFGVPELNPACEVSWFCFNGTDEDGDGHIDQTFGNVDWECMGYLDPDSVNTCPQ